MSTDRSFQIIDITSIVEGIVDRLHVKNGIVTIFAKHTTCCIRINEMEDKLSRDFVNFFEKIAPMKNDYYHNQDTIDERPNAHSHIRSMLLNSGEIIPISNGHLCLGQWQRVFFVELDGPREERKFVLQVIGE